MAGRKWPEGCAIGCGVLVLIALVVGGISWLGMMQLSGKAIESRAALDEAYPSQETYTPPLDAAIPADRLERFIAVREELMGSCADFAAHRAVFLRMDEFEEMEEEPPADEFLSEAGSLPKTLWRVGKDVHRYAVCRNEALLNHELGLGEYTWIHVTVYYGWLGHKPVDFLPDKDVGAKVFDGRVRGQVMEMMRRHVTELEAVAGGAPGSDPPEAALNLGAWRAELVALQNDPKRVPFQDGVPPELAASLEPYRAELEQLFCEATGELDLMQTVKTGLWYDHR